MSVNVPIITVFTPAYNRAHTLTRTYDSLKRQNNKSFIWLIIDDGSTDDTEKLVRKWMETETEFEIQYIYKENGGMHTAHNVAYQNIKTELNVCIDSDDCMAEDGIQIILDEWEKIKGEGYAGLVGLDADLQGKVIGKSFPDTLKETTLSGYYASGGTGDKKLVYRTDIIKKYPEYPVFEGERYVGLNYKYLLIDQDYKLAIINKVLCNVEYQEDGSSKNMLKQYVNNPRGFAFLRKVYMQYPTSKKRVFIDCIHYVSSCIIAKDRMVIKKSPRKMMTVLAYPFGIFLTIYIKNRTK